MMGDGAKEVAEGCGPFGAGGGFGGVRTPAGALGDGRSRKDVKASGAGLLTPAVAKGAPFGTI